MKSDSSLEKWEGILEEVGQARELFLHLLYEILKHKIENFEKLHYRVSQFIGRLIEF